MPDWTALRRSARTWHRKLRAHLPADCPLLPSAESLLAAAAVETGVDAYPMPADDPLLAGALAVLDRSLSCIWYADGAGVTGALSHFVRAHEYAHVWLHSDVTHDTCQADDSADRYMEGGASVETTQVAEGYGPAERREREANVFAAELLLPADTLRHLFIEERWAASRIATHVGVSESCVLAQLSSALFQPPSSDDESDAGSTRTTHALDTSQREAAFAPHGPLLVDAGPGTGKTRTLIARLAWLIESGQAAPDNILAVTFSNQAAEEMRVRLRASVGAAAERVWIGTFHAFGYEILRKDGDRIGLPPSPTLLDPSDAVTLLEQNLERLVLDEYEYLFRPSLPFPDILSCISAAKDELCGPERYLELARTDLASAGSDARALRAARRSIEIAGIYTVYQQLLAEHGLLDFGDLIMRAVELLDRCPDVRERWQRRFPHLLADEYQDINRASAQLLRRLAGHGQGFWAVGDLRQAIYRFRGASPANVRDFEQDFPNGRRYRLQQNYRSHPDIVGLASSFAESMPNVGPSMGPWTAVRRHSDSPALCLAIADDEQAQVDGLAGEIQVQRKAGVALKEQAILCHTNRQAAQLAEALERRGIATLNLGGFFEREEVRDLLSVVSLAGKPDGVALVRLARLYGIPLDDVTSLFTAAHEASKPFPAALDLHETLDGISPAGREGLTRLSADLRPNLYRGDAWYLLSRFLFETSDYLRPILTDPTPRGAQRRVAIYQLLQVVQSLARRLPPIDGDRAHGSMLDNLRHRLICGQDRLAPRGHSSDTSDAIRLMTIHQSKGLEFRIVYLPDLADGLFPPRKAARMAAPPATLTAPSGVDEKAIEEESEACLFFVALTRARDQLFLIRPATRNGRPVGPAALLASLEPALDLNNVSRLIWLRSDSCPSIAVAPDGPSATPLELRHEPFTAAALEQYQQCPRRFYYRSVLRLPEPDSRSPYLTFHRCLEQTQTWLDTERVGGKEPTDTETEERFNQLWADTAEEQTAHSRVLRALGPKLLAAACQRPLPACTRRPRRELVAHLDAGKVRVSVDRTEEMPDGSLRLLDVRTGRPGQDDHTEPRLALLRHAARQEAPELPTEIVIDYVRTGDRKEVKEAPRWEPARVDKYNIALQAVTAGRFEPDPEPRKCALCPFFLICPV